MKSGKLTLVVPSYNEEESLPLFYETTEKITRAEMPEVEIEYLFIDAVSYTHLTLPTKA